MVKTGAMGVKWTDGVEGKIITYMLRYDTIISSDGAWPGAANGALAANPRCELILDRAVSLCQTRAA